MGLKVPNFLLSSLSLITILTCAYRMRIHFCPKHWLLCHLGLYELEFGLILLQLQDTNRAIYHRLFSVCLTKSSSFLKSLQMHFICSIYRSKLQLGKAASMLFLLPEDKIQHMRPLCQGVELMIIFRGNIVNRLVSERKGCGSICN